MTTLERRQAAMRARHGRKVKRGRPTRAAVDELSADRLYVARAHLYAFCLLRKGLDTRQVAVEVQRVFGKIEVTPEKVTRWLDDGAPLVRRALGYDAANRDDSTS